MNKGDTGNVNRLSDLGPLCDKFLEDRAFIDELRRNKLKAGIIDKHNIKRYSNSHWNRLQEALEIMYKKIDAVKDWEHPTEPAKAIFGNVYYSALEVFIRTASMCLFWLTLVQQEQVKKGGYFVPRRENNEGINGKTGLGVTARVQESSGYHK